MYKYYGTINDFFQLNSQSVADMSLNPEVSFNWGCEWYTSANSA